MCYSNRLTIHKLIINVWHQELVEQMHFFNIFHTVLKFETSFCEVERSIIFILYIMIICNKK